MFRYETSVLLIIILSVSTSFSIEYSDDKYNIKLIQSYLKESIPNYVSIVGCFEASGNYVLSKKMSEDFKYFEIFSMVDTYNVFKIRNKNYNFRESIIFFSDCMGNEEILSKSGQLNLFDSTHYWLIISKNNDVLNHLKRTILNIDCNINLLISNKNSSNNFFIVDVYNPASQHGGLLKYKTIGKYTDKNGYQVQKQDLKYASRRDMTGVKFNAAVVLPVDVTFPVEEYLIYDGQREVNTFNRFHARLMLYCRDYFNFTITNTYVLKSWGYLQKNNTFDGLVGALERNEVDFGLSPLLVRPDRLDRVDYGVGTWIFRGAFLFRKPELSSNFNVFLKPLPLSIWISALVMFFISICLYKSMVYALERKYNYPKENIGWMDLVFFIVGAISQQGSVIRPNLFCGRMVLLSVITLSYLLYQFYSASILAYLVMKPPSLINTPADLLASNMECRVESTLFIMDFFLRAKDKVTSSLYRKNRREESNGSYFISAEAGLRKVMKGGVAFHAELATAYPIMETMFPENIICELEEIDIMGTMKPYCAFREKSPFKEMFSVEVQRLAETGILRRELNHWHPKKPECLNLSNRIKYTFGLEDLYPAFILLLSGVVLGFILNFVERYAFSSIRVDRK